MLEGGYPALVWMSVVIFTLTYLVISGQRLPLLRLDRPSAALCGAVAMVLSGALSSQEAYAAINFDTISLLLAMMLFCAYLSEAGFFRLLAYRTVLRARTPSRLLIGLVFAAGALSAVLVNDAVCVMFTPIVVQVVRDAALPPLPFLLALASAANIGGVVSLAGNPQNMIIGTSGHLAFGRYFFRMLPVGILGLALDAALLYLLFHKELPKEPLPLPKVAPPVGDRETIRKALVALSSVVVGFLLGRPMAGTALVGAVLLMIMARTASRAAFEKVDWSLLVFFASLFVVIEGAARSGLVARAHDALAPLFGSSAASQLIRFGLFTEMASNVFSNVPYVLVARNWVQRLAQPEYQWTGLAMSATLSGNLTLVGSVANLIVFELAGPLGRVGFLRFFRYGLLITAVTSLVGFGVLLVEMRLGV
jgi:Na+/H+ antiporter NhaD/arsenite permease-like protein